ncbi:MAG: AAA family ATPase [Candidatus Nanohaloarchaea archaeon]|nr:AAA family ATPase [Candidatus Nanohaloarchaea archaeon]
MLVFVNGIAGCGEKEYLAEFEQVCEERGVDVEVHALGERILEIGRRDYPGLGKYDLLKFPESTVNAWRAAAFESIKEDITDGGETIHVLDAHASFWKKNGPEPAINTSYLKQLNPDIYVQIIDYEPDIRDRLHAKEDIPEEYKLSLEEVIRWQETERYTNRVLSDHHQKPFYVLARQHPGESLFNLVTDETKPAVYQSFPITNLDEESLQGVKEYVEELRNYATVFDPIEIETRDFEDERIKQLINNHTVKRDQQFIDQSELVIVNFPEMVYSSGVEYEINYASRTGKPVWIIKPEGYAGPFTEYNCEREFSNEEECLEALQEEFGD